MPAPFFRLARIMQRTTADNFHAWLRLMLEPHLIRTLPTGAPTNIFKAVLDTTVLVAAMLRPESEGVSAEVLKLAAEGRYEFFLSDDILEETAVTLAASERNRRRCEYSDKHFVAYCGELARIGTVIFDIPNCTGIGADDLRLCSLDGVHHLLPWGPQFPSHSATRIL